MVVSFIRTSEGHLDSEYFNQSEESSQFRHEYEMRKMKQVRQICALLSFGVYAKRRKDLSFILFYGICHWLI